LKIRKCCKKIPQRDFRGKRKKKRFKRFNRTGSGICEESLTVNRNTVFDNSCNITSSPVSLPTETTDKRINSLGYLRRTNGSRSQSRDLVVDSQSKIEQWKVFNLETSPASNQIGCLKGRLWAYCQGERTGGPWSKEERELHINISYIIESCKISNSSLYSKQKISEQHPHSDGQHGGSVLPCENGGNK